LFQNDLLGIDFTASKKMPILFKLPLHSINGFGIIFIVDGCQLVR
jgi:hypothetical protein